jgi:hypothetical protein
LCKNTKTIIPLMQARWLSGTFTSTSSRWIFPDKNLAFGE